jgi:hypothetical protein
MAKFLLKSALFFSISKIICISLPMIAQIMTLARACPTASNEKLVMKNDINAYHLRNHKKQNSF